MRNILRFMTDEGKSDLPAVLGLAPDAELDPAVRAFRTVLALAHVLRSRMDERLRADGLTTMQAAVLTAVVQLGSSTVSDLAAALGSSRQNLTQLVTALQRKDLVEVVTDPGDRRRQQITVTAAAREYWAARDDGDHRAVASWFAALTPAELARFTALAGRVLQGVDR